VFGDAFIARFPSRRIETAGRREPHLELVEQFHPSPVVTGEPQALSA
jgi:hypothetical protein